MTIKVLAISGGLDSTVCLMETIMSMSKDDTLKLFYIELKNNYAKTWVETEAVDAILKDINAEKLAPSILSYEKIMIDEIKRVRIGTNIPIMAFLFVNRIISQLQSFIEDDRYDDIEIIFGYTKGDDATESIENIKDIITVSSKALYDGKIPKFKFPVISDSKTKSFRKLEAWDEELNLDLTSKLWICESPKRSIINGHAGYKHCGDCVPCSRHKKIKGQTQIKY